MDNKKHIALAVLVLALLGVGVFQFVGGGSEAPAAATAEKPKEAAKVVAKVDTVHIPPLGARDPFAPGKLPGAVEGTESEPQPAPAPSSGGQDRLPPPKDIFGDGGSLPVLPGPEGAIGGGQPPIQVTPTFNYVLVGVVTGDTPAAVFADSAGNQRLITLGGSIDGDSKVVAIENGKVVVKFGKDTLTLTIGGTASEK